METRRCGACEDLIVPYETYRLAGLPMAHRYRCPGCSTKFDLWTRFGQYVVGSIAVVIPLVVLLLPDRKFEKPSERPIILLLGLIQLVVTAVVLVRDRATHRRHPPLPADPRPSQLPR